MVRQTLAICLFFGTLTMTADVLAQSLEDEILESEHVGESAENTDALPGTYRVTEAAAMRTGLAMGLTLGYGYTEDVFQQSDRHHRVLGAAAATFRPIPWVAAGLRINGRYDRHNGDMIASDDGYVAEARINLLATRMVSEKFAVGGQIAAWIPGGISGLSLDLKGVATAHVGPASVSFNGGFRLDRSAESVDDADLLSKSDRLALGVSDSNAVLLGLGAEMAVGPVRLIAEASWDLLVGNDAPPAIESPLRAGAGVRVPLTDTYSLSALLEGGFGRAPFIDAMEPLVPVEPLVGLTVLIGARPKSTGRTVRSDIDVVPVGGKPGDTRPIDPRALIAGLSGTVRDEGGVPITGAVVRVAGREVLTGDGGTFVAEQLEPGEITVVVSADGYGDESEKVRIAKDEVREISIILKRLELGTLRGVVRSFSGAPVLTEVVIHPGNHRVTSDSDGTFELKLPAGDYTATASKDGFRSGTSKAKIRIPGPTVIINLELLQKAP